VDYVLVLNNDTTVQPDMLDELMAYAGAPDVGMLSPKIITLPSRNASGRSAVTAIPSRLR
jgi:GT2 family glycosyltransferase